MRGSPLRATAPLFAVSLLLPAAGAQTCPVAVVEDVLTSSPVVKGAAFGTRVSISGETLASSSPLEQIGAEDEAGAVYVATRSGSTWTQEQRLTMPVPTAFDEFGLGLALDGDTLAAGAPFADRGANSSGAVRVFTRSQGVWSEEAELTPPVPQGGAAYGWAVALQGDNLLVGAPYHNAGAGAASGAVFVYTRQAGVWTLDATLLASDGADGDYFGYSVALDGVTAVVGAYGVGAFSEGAAYVFRLNATGWVEEGKLSETPSLPQRLFGYSVAVQANLVLVGAPSTGLVLPQPGSVLVFQRQGGAWNEIDELTASNGVPLDFFGGVMDFNAPWLLVSARDADRAYVWLLAAGTWFERLQISAEELGTARLEGLAVESPTLVIGSPFDALPGAAGAGQTRTLRITAGTGAHVSYCTAGVSASGCQAIVSSCGTPSATASGGFVVVASSLEGNKDGIFFFGTSGRQANPWGNGTSYQCVVPPVRRGGLVGATGTAGLCDGLAKQDLNALWCPECPAPLKNPGPGGVVQAQFWYRDPQSTSNQTTSLSDALEFTVGP